jgi:hypothetical protein
MGHNDTPIGHIWCLISNVISEHGLPDRGIRHQLPVLLPKVDLTNVDAPEANSVSWCVAQ